MKRILSILLAITLLIASGCGSNSGNNEQPDNAQTNNTQNTDTNDTIPPDDATDENTGDTSEGEDASPEADNAPIGDSDYNPTETGWKKGDTIADFSFTSIKGSTYTLSEILMEKDAVLINIFATWCGPCKNEFPFMEQVYKKLQDKIEIVALSGDGSDNIEKIQQVANSLGLTFPMGMDSAGISAGVKLSAYPTTLLVDRFGTIVFFQIGSFEKESDILNMFEYLISEEYTESVIIDKIPPTMPHLEKLSDEALSGAMGEAGLVFTNAPGVYNWPMAQADGVLVSTNQGMDRSRSAVQTTVTAAAGEVFAFDFKLASEAGYDFMTLTVNGEIVKAFSGEKDWMSFGYEFPADGEYLIELAYVKDEATDSGDDTLWLDNARVLSGDEAAAVLAANPSYPTAAETSFQITNKDATRVVFDDPYKVVYKIFGCPYEAYLLNGQEANFQITISADVDPEAAICYDNKGNTYVLTSLASGDGYSISFTVDSLDNGGKGYTYVILDPDALHDGEEYPIVFFADVAGMEKFAKSFAAGEWHDAEEWEASQGEQNEEPQGDVTYTLRCVDENGERISGVTLQVCNDATCSVYVTDANGECVLTLPADNYEIHILKAPEGYTFDSEAVVTAPIEGGEVTLSLTRA